MTEQTTTTRPKRTRATTPSKATNKIADDAKQAAPKERKETVQQLKNRLRNEAEREVLNDHKDEVIDKTAAKYKEHNLEYVRRLTDEEKAAKEVADNFEKYPALREQMLRELAKQQEQQQTQRTGYESSTMASAPRTEVPNAVRIAPGYVDRDEDEEFERARRTELIEPGE